MKTLKSLITVLCLAAAAFMAVSCKPGVPDEYIQPGKMEDILYDYHLAMAVAEQNGDGETRGVRKQAYKMAVLKKYGVTEQQMEESMKYYTRHTEQLHDIYENLSERFNDEAKELGTTGASTENEYAQNGDTTNVWSGARNLILMPEKGMNTYSFDVKVDTAFHKGDRLALEFNTNYIIQEGMRNAQAIMKVTLKNDSIVMQTLRITSDSRTTLTFLDFGKIGIKSIEGFFIFPQENMENPSSTLKILCLTKIRMLRIHSQTPKTAPLSSFGTQKPVAPNGPNVKPGPGLTPREKAISQPVNGQRNIKPIK